MAMLVKFLARVPEHDTEVYGALGVIIDKDEATDSYLGFMPALELYSQGRTSQEAERLMEKAAALYLATAVREKQLSDILLKRGFRRRAAGKMPSAEGISIRKISTESESGGGSDSGGSVSV